MMRVLHVTTGGRIGGAERLIADLVRAGRALDLFEASVCILGNPDALGREVMAEGATLHALGARGPLGLALATARLAGLIRRGRYDIVHAHLIHGSAFGLLAARAAGSARAVMTRHYERYVQMYGSPLERVLHPLGHRLADHVFAISEAARRVLVVDERFPSDRVTVVPNGIDVDRVRRLAGPTRPPHHAVTVGSIGSLHPRKGHADLIRAIAQVRPDRRTELVIVGDGPARAQLEALSRAVGVADRVRFAGYVSDPYPILRTFDIYVQPSREEGFGIAVLEAMALELPVIATDIGGLPEIVTDGSTGLLVAPGDPVALAARVDRLLGDPDLGVALGRAARERVESRSSSRGAAIAYAKAYRELLAHPVSR